MSSEAPTMPGPTDKRAVGFAVVLARGVVALALRISGGDEVTTKVCTSSIKVTTLPRREDGVSILEYVLLVALVAMVATGTLLYTGAGKRRPIACGEQRR